MRGISRGKFNTRLTATRRFSEAHSDDFRRVAGSEITFELKKDSDEGSLLQEAVCSFTLQIIEVDNEVSAEVAELDGIEAAVTEPNSNEEVQGRPRQPDEEQTKTSYSVTKSQKQRRIGPIPS